MKKKDVAGTEALLRSHERWCMNACNRYINRSAGKDNVWLHKNEAGNILAIIVNAKQSLLPVLGDLLGDQKIIPPPHFLRGFFGAAPIHSLQGRKEDVLIMEAAMENTGLCAEEKIDYDLMCIDHPPSGFNSVCAGLVIRKPHGADMNALAALHAAYEQEEVLPAAADFNAAVSRLNMERIFSKEQMLVAELDGRLAGKINTNAVTFTRFQIGGVYVHPEFRRLGIARRMAGEFTASLASQGRGISLFVKKSNPSARRV